MQHRSREVNVVRRDSAHMIGLKQLYRGERLSPQGSLEAAGVDPLAQPLTAMHAKTTSISFLIALLPGAQTAALWKDHIAAERDSADAG